MPIGVFWPGDHLDSMFDEGRLSEEDYIKFQDGIRSSALLLLKEVKEAYKESMEEIEVKRLSIICGHKEEKLCGYGL